VRRNPADLTIVQPGDPWWPDWPAGIRAPVRLFVTGDPALLQAAWLVAVVGSRSAPQAALEWAGCISYELASEGGS